MNNNNSKGKVTVLGIDLAKNSFQLHGVDEKGNRVLKKKLTRKQLVAFIAQLPPLFNRNRGLWWRTSLGAYFE